MLFENSQQAGGRQLSQKYEGLLTRDGDLTTGLVVIVADCCSWLPDNETNDFTARSAHRLSADER